MIRPWAELLAFVLEMSFLVTGIVKAALGEEHAWRWVAGAVISYATLMALCLVR